MISVIKGKEFEYIIEFTESAGTPPTYTVKTPAGVSFLTGTADAIYGDDKYSCKLTIPPTAPSSTAALAWTITWVDATVQKVVYFDVKDPDIPDDEIYLRELTKFVIENRDYNFKLVIPEVAEDCSMELFGGASSITSDIDNDIEDHRLGCQIVGTIATTYLSAGEYVLIYTTDVGEYHQSVLVCPIKFMPILTKVRFIVDRILKSIDQPQTYLESDLLASIFGGIDIVNMVAPVTDWTVISLPTIIQPFLQIAAGIYLLNSQYMLESDLAFAYSGNTVSLDYDRTGAIESQISRLQEMLNENLMKAKKTVLRDSPGILGITGSPVGPNGLFISRHHQLIKHR